MRLPLLVVFSFLALSGAQETEQDIRDQFKDVFTELWGTGNTSSTGTGSGFSNTGGPVVLGGQETCICVPYYNCDPDTNKIIRDGKTDGFGVIDIRFGQQGPVKKCDHYLDVCCEDVPESSGINHEGPSFEKPEKNPPPPVGPPVTPPPPFDGPVKCGIRNPKGLEFQITGNNHDESEYGEFPWMTTIIRKDYDYNVPQGDKNLALCGGSVINEHVILTGAHCVEKYKYNPSEIKIRAGEWDTQTARERYPYQERDVAEILVHEQFHPKSVFNDIALVILATPLKFANNIKPVCLPKHGEIFNQYECYVTGWGKTIFGKKGKPSVILKKIDLPMVDRNTCEHNLRRTRLGKLFNLHKSFICAGGIQGKDACTGDGGGPLVCPNGGENRYEQAGIVAWGIGCGQKDVPGVYASVALFRNWIDAHMKRLGFGTKSYTQ